MATTRKTPEASPVTAYFYGRLSDNKQEAGTGFERQIENPKKWSERRGIPLDETLSFFDKGRSGFHGDHRRRKDGGLYLFLQACEQKRVAPGSFLLVESLDRLSREQLHEGQQLIHQLLFKYKIRLVVLFGGEVEYNAKNYETTHWAIDAEFARAHSESLMKSIRTKDNWERKRRTLHSGGRITRKIPAWLRWENGQPKRDEAKAATVNHIFDLAIKGFGFASIAKRLNKDQTPTLGGTAYWRDSYVEKILKSRSVLGEYQPCRMEVDEDTKKRQRVKAGEVVPNYFPQIVTADKFLAAKQAIESRREKRGRISQKVSNLFTHLVFDERGEAMAFAAKGGVGYLQSGRRDNPGVKYIHFERVVLSWFRAIKLQLSNTTDTDALRLRADKLAGVIRTLKAKIDAEPDDLADLLDMYAQKKRDHAEMAKQIESAAVPLQSHFLQSQSLIDALDAATGDDRETMRRELRQSIRMVIEKIRVKVSNGERGGKLILVIARFKDGRQRGVLYITKGGRVLMSEGLWREGDPEWQELRDQLATDFKGRKPTPEEELAFWDRQGLYYRDPEPVNDLKIKCKEMRANKKSYKEIEAATGLHRTTIYRYLYDYDRTDDQTGRAKRTSSSRKATRRRGR